MAPLAAFQAYNGITDAFFTFFRGGLTNPDSSIATYAEGEGAVDEGQAVEYIGREATLVGGALAAGGVMSQAEHQLFVQAIGARLLVQQAGVSPLYWQGYTDPYPAGPGVTRVRELRDAREPDRGDRSRHAGPGEPAGLGVGGPVGRGGVQQRRGRSSWSRRPRAPRTRAT